MERSEIRGPLSQVGEPIPDCASLHPGYGYVSTPTIAPIRHVVSVP